jgi:YidC/Oxa1 family membrane protein insertase
LDNQRNFILAVVLSMLVFLGWNLVAQTYFPQPKRAPVSGQAGTAPAQGITPPVKIAVADAKAVVGQTPRIAIETPKLVGSINLKGARIDDLVMPAYRETIEKGAAPVRLLSPQGAKNAYFAGFGWVGDGLSAPGPDTVWTASAAKLTPTTPVTLTWDNQKGQLFVIQIAVDKAYMFTINQSVTNNSAGAVTARAYGYVNRLKPEHAVSSSMSTSREVDSWTIHIGPIGAFNNAVNYDVNYSDLDTAGDAGKRFANNGGWLGFGDAYWLTAMIPAQKSPVDAGFRKGSGSYQAEYFVPQSIVAPGKTVSQASHFFAGAKEVATLDGYESSLGITHFGKAIDWGWFEIIEKPIFYLLDWLFKFTGNFGVAIMLLTCIVRGAMFPIAQRQFASMAAMRVVQPKLKALQERYKDDKVKLQSAMMELYKTEKINPVAGCLPVFLQIPIFFALYKVLMLTIEMRHQPFLLWIRDLSEPDPANLVELANLASISLPHILGIGVLAVILGVTMYLQFKLNPAPADPAQAQVFAIMPWMMMFMMAPFAAGLLLYWATSNILTIAQQKLLYSRHPALREPVKT